MWNEETRKFLEELAPFSPDIAAALEEIEWRGEEKRHWFQKTKEAEQRSGKLEGQKARLRMAFDQRKAVDAARIKELEHTIDAADKHTAGLMDRIRDLEEVLEETGRLDTERIRRAALSSEGEEE